MSSNPESWCSVGAPEPPPQNSPPQVIPGLASKLCSYGWRRIMITGMLRDQLIRHFATPHNIEEPDLRQYLWNAGDTTGILIESIHRWRGDVVEKRPAVIVKPNAYQNVRMGLADVAGADGQGNTAYATMWVGSHTLFCIHGTGASADILAGEVQREITEFAPVLEWYLGLHRVQVTEVGEISEIEEARESFVVPVTVGWAYQQKWKLQLEALKVRKIPLSVLLDGALYNGG